MKKVIAALLSLLLLIVSCAPAEPKNCLVTVDDGFGNIVTVNVLEGSEYFIESKIHEGYRITVVTDQVGTVYSVGTKIKVTSDIVLTYSWEVYTPVSDFRWDITDEHVHVESYIGTSAVVRIPDSVNGRNVTGIGKDVFKGNVTVTEVVLPESIEVIGANAFDGCRSLSDLNIPAGLKTIESGAFKDCVSIKEFTIPSTISLVSHHAFSGWTEKQIINISKDMMYYQLESEWDGNCKANVVWPDDDSVHWILHDNGDTWSIAGYDGTDTNLVCPSKVKGKYVTSILPQAFRANKSIESIKISSSIDTIYDEAFVECESLSYVDFRDAVNLKNIYDRAFFLCSSLTSIDLPESIRNIGENAFASCAIRNVNIPAGLINIGAGAFNSKAFERMTVDPENMYLYVVDGCLLAHHNSSVIMGTSLAIIPTDPRITTIANKAFAYTGIKNIEIPENITTVGDSAFHACSQLESITLSKNTVNLGRTITSRCGALNKINVEDGNPKYHSAGNGLIDTYSKTLVLGCKATVIPDDGTVNAIGEAAFYENPNLETLVIPSTIEHIGVYAFRRCFSLSGICIPASVKGIGNYAFSEWNADQTINIDSRADTSKWENMWNYEMYRNGNGFDRRPIKAQIVYL